MGKIASCLALIVGVYISVVAQTHDDQYLQTVWTTENGLPQNSVNAILQSREGYLWLGTFGGLIRFDGVKFSVFDSGNTPALKGTRIISLYEDRAGALWIGAEFGGLARYAVGQFTSWDEKDGLPAGKVNAICSDRQGNLWVGTNRGLARFTGGVFKTLTAADGFPGTLVHLMVQGNNGDALWILSDAGLTLYAGGVFVRTWPLDAIYLTNPKSLDQDAEGNLWIVSSQGVARFRDDALTPLAQYSSLQSSLADDRVLKTYRDRQGAVCFLTSRGLARYRNDRLEYITRIEGFERLKPDSLLVRALIEDREGNIWIGTDGKGLHRIRKPQIRAYAGEEGLVDASFLAIAEDAAGGVLLLGDPSAGGPFRYFNGVIRNLRWSFLEGHGMMTSVLQARDGSVWIGDYKQVSVVRDGRLINQYVFRSDPKVGNPVQAIFEDREGNIWIGVSDEGGSGGLHRISNGILTSFRTSEGLVHNNVRRIMQDSSGALWIGTTGGLSRYQNGRFANYTIQNGLTHNYIREVHETADGSLWLGSYGGGLIRYKQGIFTPITTRDGLFDNVVSRILEDDYGNFWMSCNWGIFRVPLRQLQDFADGKADSITCAHYDVADGMRSSECNGGHQPAGWKARDGRLWFPTQRGVVVVDPNLINPIPPLVKVESLLANEAFVPIEQGEINIAPGAGDLEIHYTGISLSVPEKVQFKYRLDGHDGDWVEVGTRRIAYYTNLSPGKYRFHVIASNYDGIWNPTGATLEFYLQPRFYQTRIFYACCLLGLLGLFAGGNRWRLRHLIRRNEELEGKVAERTARLLEQSEALVCVNEQLQGANEKLAHANARLEASHQEMLSTLNQLRLGVIMTDRTGTISFVSNAAERLLDLSDAQSRGQRWESCLPLTDKDREQLRSLIQLPPNRRGKASVRVETAEAGSCWIEVDIREDARDPEYLLFLFYDVTEVYDLRRLLDDKAQFHGLVGQSRRMQLVYKQVKDLAQVDTTVLVTGETGTGKELVARAIHFSSPRRNKPFIAVNCAGLTESLLASQLFGHRRGAFTGAVADQIGMVEAAAGGTLFLDEIGDIPPSVQTSLLRVLQEKEITRLGESKPRKVDVRILTATHRDLAQAVAAGTFREDLYYRICIAKIEIPALRERLDDLPLLVAWFLGQIRTSTGKSVQEFSRDAMQVMMEYHWPGNVRELRSAIETAIICCRGPIIQVDDLPSNLLHTPRIEKPAADFSQADTDEATLVRNALKRTRGNRAEAARLLGISRSTLYRRMAALQISHEENK